MELIIIQNQIKSIVFIPQKMTFYKMYKNNVQMCQILVNFLTICRTERTSAKVEYEEIVNLENYFQKVLDFFGK